MQMYFFDIPAQGGDEQITELNRLLASNRVVDVQRHFVNEGAGCSWHICVTVVAKRTESKNTKGTVDYREILSESDFSLYAQLRTLRKTIAEKEGVPAYALFTNEQLAELVRKKVKSIPEMGRIAGIGQARLGKYGDIFIEKLKQMFCEEPERQELNLVKEREKNQN